MTILKYFTIISALLFTIVISHKHKIQCTHAQKREEYKKLGLVRKNPQDPTNINIDNSIQQDKNTRRKLGQGSVAQNMRVTIDFTRINNVTNASFKNAMIDVVNVAAKQVSDIFMVYPEDVTIKIKNQQWIEGYESLCESILEKEGIRISAFDKDPGISQSDLHIYVSYVDLKGKPENEQFKVQGQACSWINDRALVGYLKLNLDWFTTNFSGTGLEFEYFSESVLHELFHILGFGADNIPFFRNKEGFKMTEDEVKAIYKTQKVRGIDTPILSSENVLKAVREHYGCETASGGHLENEGGSVGQHWDRVMFFNDIMGPTEVQDDAVVSPITLAYFEDTHWFAEVNMDKAEQMQWGKGRGCKFFDSCDSTFPEFKQTTDPQSCTFYHYGAGTSQVDKYSDTCPISKVIPETVCQNPKNANAVNDEFTMEKYSRLSRCFDSNFITAGKVSTKSQRCYEFYCDREKKELTIYLSDKLGGQEAIKCTSDAQVLTHGLVTGTLNCPKSIAEFCDFPIPCPNYCSQKGYCLYQNGRSTCHCIEGYAGLECQNKCFGIMDQDGKKCLDGPNCPDDKQYTDGSKQCQPCHSSCTKYCNAYGETGCRDCKQGYYQLGSQCVSNCGSGKFANNATGKCDDCHQNCNGECIRSSTNCIFKTKIDSGQTIIGLKANIVQALSILSIVIAMVAIL